MKKTYYIANGEHIDAIYGNADIICMDITEVRRLAHEWNMTTKALLEQMHKASDSEIAEFGVYNSEK